MNGFQEQQLVLFSLILMRMSGFIFFNPLMRRSELTALFKSGLAFVLTMMLYPISSAEEFVVTSSLVFGMLLLREFFIGMVLGFVMELFFSLFISAGAVIDFHMGLSMSTVYDAGSRTQSALTGTILYIYTALLFLAVDGHMAMIRIVMTASEFLPYGAGWHFEAMPTAVLDIFVYTFALMVQFSFPIIAIEFIGEVGVGILMKIIPQINIFILNMQIKVVLGLIMLGFLMSPIGSFINVTITQLVDTTTQILHIMAGL